MTEIYTRISSRDAIRKGSKPVQAIERVQILLEADRSEDRNPVKERVIAEKVGVSIPTVKAVKKAFHVHRGNVEKVVIRIKREMGPR